MLVYRCNVGHTEIDEVPSWILDEVQCEEIFNDSDITWSGQRWDYFSNEPERVYSI